MKDASVLLILALAVVALLAGTSGAYAFSKGVAVDSRGNVYSLNDCDSNIRRVSPNNSRLRPWKRDRVDSSAIAIDSRGNVIVAGLARIRVYTPSGRRLRSIKLRGSHVSTVGVTTDSRGSIYVLLIRDMWNGGLAVRKYSQSGRLLSSWKCGAPGGDLWDCGDGGIAVDKAGCIYVLDAAHYRIEKRSQSGRLLARWGSQGRKKGCFERPVDIALDRNSYVYVSDMSTGIQKFSPSGKFLALLENCDANHMAISSSGQFYVQNVGGEILRKLSPTGKLLAEWVTPESPAKKPCRPTLGN